MKCIVYILHSVSTNRCYADHTKNLVRRLYQHNSGENKSTKHGAPWKVVFTEKVDSRSEAMKIEMRIKKRGIRRYLNGVAQP